MTDMAPKLLQHDGPPKGVQDCLAWRAQCVHHDVRY